MPDLDRTSNWDEDCTAKGRSGELVPRGSLPLLVEEAACG